MILWLASYPKSGNTYLRALLVAYFFTKEGNFDFDKLKFTKFFPHINLFKNLGIDITDENEVLKNYIKAQEMINKKYNKSILFVKTHSTLQSINGNQFTNLDNTLGAIYVVRDPRNVVTSYSNHYQTSVEQSAHDMFTNTYLKGMVDYNSFQNHVLTHLGTWADNYNSWKHFNKFNKYLLIKYEDIVSKPDVIFQDVLKFIAKISNTNLKIDKKKMENAINTTTFENLKQMEEKKGFIEAVKRKDNNITFFKQGSNRDWKKLLTNEIKNKIEKSFNTEMKELGYL
tara:strand:+ start:3306 stop:4160 length:855 start_codon:yes stop_codon:yes gene_type:complete